VRRRPFLLEKSSQNLYVFPEEIIEWIHYSIYLCSHFDLVRIFKVGPLPLSLMAVGGGVQIIVDAYVTH